MKKQPSLKSRDTLAKQHYFIRVLQRQKQASFSGTLSGIQNKDAVLKETGTFPKMCYLEQKQSHEQAYYGLRSGCF